MTSSATLFALQFDTQFRLTTSGLPVLEIPLFRALQSTLIGLSSSFRVEEYHGGGHQVGFLGNGTFARRNAQCELSDLAIIVYSRVSRTARLTYLQAKAERAGLGPACGHKFSANLEQWFLLAKRPQLRGVRRFNPPADLLSAALLESVGTFGFFYRDVAGDFQIYYATAAYLSPPGTYSQRYGKLQAKGPCTVLNTQGFRECLAACGNQSFAASLYRLEIGTPVDRMNGRASVRNWLAGNLRVQIREAPGRSAAAEELLDILGAQQTDESASGSVGAKSLIIIESDMASERQG
jgi:hypothetical protein